MNRRDWVRLAAGTGVAVAWGAGARSLHGQTSNLITRPIPSTGERIPVVGLGSSATFSQVARSEDVSSLREVLKTMSDLGGTVFDTAPSYGASEEVAGRLVGELGIRDKVFWATKVNVAPRGGGSADPAAAREQIETSFRRLGRPTMDLIQVHNLGDLPTQLGLLREYKQQKRLRYLGVTTTSDRQYAELEALMRNEPLDFIEIDYSIANRNVEDAILPLAIERKVGVIVAVPFGRAALFPRVAGKPLPDWAGEIGVASWAQFFLKFLIGHPAVTVAIPATSRPTNMRDNMGAAVGKVPDEATRRRMAEYFGQVATS
ncbi:MAG: aldo/keto reductase [Gemmatimonadetes bacterium]|nr:aldo/keto reductase [Gemmatimonadota bacterium]